MSKYKTVPVEPTRGMERAAESYWNERRFKGLTDDPRTWAGVYQSMLAAAPDVQGEPVAVISGSHCFSLGDANRLMRLPTGTKLYTAPQPAPDVDVLAEALESILHGSLLDACGNRGDDGISSAISMGIQRDSLQRWRKIARQALATYRKQGGDL